MAKKKRREPKQTEDVQDKQLAELTQLVENSTIVSLAMQGFSYQVIRKVIGGDIHRVTKFLKPINREIKKLRKKKPE